MVNDSNALRLVIDEVIEQNQSIHMLKADVAGLKADVAGLKEGQQRLEDGQTYISVTMEALHKDLRLILDAVIPAKARAAQLDQVVDTAERQEARLGALETAFKEHVSGHAAPR